MKPKIRVDRLRVDMTRALMESEGVTQRQLADRWERDKAAVSRWLSGARTIPYDRLVDLASLLSQPPAMLADIAVEGGCPECPHCRALLQP